MEQAGESGPCVSNGDRAAGRAARGEVELGGDAHEAELCHLVPALLARLHREAVAARDAAPDRLGAPHHLAESGAGEAPAVPWEGAVVGPLLPEEGARHARVGLPAALDELLADGLAASIGE